MATMPAASPSFDAARLIDAYFDGIISETEFEQLSQWLRGDDRHMRQFAAAAVLHTSLHNTLHDADLRSFFGRQEVASDLLRLVDPQNIQLMLEEAAEAEADRAAPSATVVSDPPRRRPPEVRIPWHAIGYVGSAAAAVLLFVLAQWIASPGDNQVVPETALRGQSATVEAPPLVATLTDALQAAWAGEQGSRPINARLAAGEYRLQSGVVELQFDSGARVVVEAPALIELHSADRLTVDHGRLVAHVPEQAIGFTVVSEAAAIVDLGTEFGVEISQSGEVGVHVLDGEVALIPDQDDSDPIRETLGMGTARLVAVDGRVEELDYNGSTFLRRVPASRYELAILKSRPIAFWRLNEAADEPQIASLGTNDDLAGNVGSGVMLGQPSRGVDHANRSIQLLGAHQGVDLGRVPALGLTRNFTIEAWVRVSRLADVQKPRRILSSFCWSPRSGLGLGVCGHHFTHDDSLPNVVPHFTFYGVYDCVGTRGLQFDRWHHLVVTVDSNERPAIYLDGIESPTKVRNEQDQFERITPNWSPTKHSVATSGACYLGRNPPASLGNPPPDELWQGGIDEVVVFDRVLSGEEIRTHFDAGLIATQYTPE